MIVGSSVLSRSILLLKTKLFVACFNRSEASHLPLRNDAIEIGGGQTDLP